MEEPPEKTKPAAGLTLTDDLLIEILRRLPVRSVCRFKCVSRSWRKLISDPAHRKKLPHTLTGFFYHSFNGERFPVKAHHFTNVHGKGMPYIFPSFSFLPVPGDQVLFLDSCNGLLLCSCSVPGPSKGDDGFAPSHYAVCNPATEEWVMLPIGSWSWGSYECCAARLGFDPAVSSDFHVVQYVRDEDECITGVEIYSSKTSSWSFKESKWGGDNILDGSTVFLNGTMHALTYVDWILAVDMEGKTWMTIPVPSGADSGCGCIHKAQGRLCYIGEDDVDAFKLSIWILEDHEWTLKHSVRTLFLFRQNLRFCLDYKVITVHPECNLIYFVYGWDSTLMAYEMGCKEVRVIRNLGHECMEPYLPYVPLFSGALGDRQ